MARTTLSATSVGPTGGATSGSAGTGDGHQFTNNGRQIIVVSNSDGAATRDITIVTGAKKGGLAIDDQVVTIAISGRSVIGPFEPTLYNQPSGATKGMVLLNFESGQESDFTVELYELP